MRKVRHVCETLRSELGPFTRIFNRPEQKMLYATRAYIISALATLPNHSFEKVNLTSLLHNLLLSMGYEEVDM